MKIDTPPVYSVVYPRKSKKKKIGKGKRQLALFWKKSVLSLPLPRLVRQASFSPFSGLKHESDAALSPSALSVLSFLWLVLLLSLVCSFHGCVTGPPALL